jgi:hypothetical protein
MATHSRNFSSRRLAAPRLFSAPPRPLRPFFDGIRVLEAARVREARANLKNKLCYIGKRCKRRRASCLARRHVPHLEEGGGMVARFSIFLGFYPPSRSSNLCSAPVPPPPCQKRFSRLLFQSKPPFASLPSLKLRELGHSRSRGSKNPCLVL